MESELLRTATLMDGQRLAPETVEVEAGAALERLVERRLPEGGAAEPVVVRIADLGLANALAATGGPVRLTCGRIAGASGPDEVAGVLAHELGHVGHRHAARMLLGDLGMSALVGGSDIGRLSDTLLSNAMSREREREADAFALSALARAGIPPQGLVDFFERNAATSECDGDLCGKLGTCVATHPPDAERLAAFRAAAACAGAVQPALDDAGWRALRAACGPGPSG